MAESEKLRAGDNFYLSSIHFYLLSDHGQFPVCVSNVSHFVIDTGMDS